VAFDDLYQEIILDHYRNPRNAARLDQLPESSVHENPTCGDAIKLIARVDPQGIVEEILFDGKGCAISMASASIMTEELKGKPLVEVRERIQGFLRIMRGEAPADGLDDWGDLACLKGVISYPVRVKCATLAWHALESALKQERAGG
jgi:nitrogen fixation protein NifU and related proteins